MRSRSTPPNGPRRSPPDVSLAGRTDTGHLRLAWCEAPWDTAIYGAPVLQLTEFEVLGPNARQDANAFLAARDAAGSKLVSCRLPAECLRESMLLEDMGFRFIEMVFLPETGELPEPLVAPDALDVRLATAADLPAVQTMAASAFGNERFHVDPRLPRALADLRYANWALSAAQHPTQRLHVLSDLGRPVAFFVTEKLADGTSYWHLNAVTPAEQGRGLGRRAWRTMMALARTEGSLRVRSSIVARNHRVLNLYASLGFHFPPPRMTFHWVAPGA
jgi:GNAT superfamily N-acetyltransferase